MSDPFGFMKYSRKDNPWRPVGERVLDFNEMEQVISEEERRQQAQRCMNCGVPHCHHALAYGGGRAVGGCPNDNLIPEWNDLLYRSEDKRAFIRLSKTNSLPDFTGHVCPAPCEISCNNALNNMGITIRNNERFLIDQAFKFGWVEDQGRPVSRNGVKVAVVGSGPAGLAAAWRLNQLGYSVTVFEKDDRAGGLAMYGIPNMKLPKEDVARRIAVMEKVGIEFQCNTTIGVDVSADDLKRDYARVILAIGARVARDMPGTPGRELQGVEQALDFLTTATKAVIKDGPASTKALAGKHVVVVGGGDTGNDCIATAVRMGASSITQLEITPEPAAERSANNPWPEWPMTRRTGYGQQEYLELFGGVLTKYTSTITEFKGEADHIQSITVNQVDHFKPVAGTEETIQADLVLLAMGFTGAQKSVFEQFGVTETADDYTTNDSQVYVAGDARRGPSLVIWAIHEGRMAAEAASQSLATSIAMNL